MSGSDTEHHECVIWENTDVPDPILTMQTAAPLLLYYGSHQAQVACSTRSVTTHLLYPALGYKYV